MRRIVFISLAVSFALSAEAEAAGGSNAKFCTYVEVFVMAMIRNRAYEMPFIRIDQFDYFDAKKSRFLESIAHEIYAALEIGSRATLAARYVEECKYAFSE